MDDQGLIVPRFNTLNRVDRSVCRTTIRDLAITSHTQALRIDPDTIINRLGDRAARDRNVRHRVRRFFLLCGRPTFSLPMPVQSQPSGVIMGGARYLTDVQRTWLASLSVDTFPVKFRRRVIAAAQILHVENTEAVLAYPMVEVARCIMAHQNPKTTVTAVAQLFRLVNRSDTITMTVVRRHIHDNGLYLTKEEHQWLDDHPDATVPYENVKRLMCATNVRMVRVQQAISIVRCIMEAHGHATWIDLCLVDPNVLVNATVSTIRSSMDHHPLALSQRGRQTRRTNVAQGEPGMDLSIAYSRSAKFLVSVALHQDPLDVNWKDRLRPRRLLMQAECGSASGGSGAGLMPVHDALSLVEMDGALRSQFVLVQTNCVVECVPHPVRGLCYCF